MKEKNVKKLQHFVLAHFHRFQLSHAKGFAIYLAAVIAAIPGLFFFIFVLSTVDNKHMFDVYFC